MIGATDGRLQQREIELGPIVCRQCRRDSSGKLQAAFTDNLKHFVFIDLRFVFVQPQCLPKRLRVKPVDPSRAAGGAALQRDCTQTPWLLGKATLSPGRGRTAKPYTSARRLNVAPGAIPFACEGCPHLNVASCTGCLRRLCRPVHICLEV